MYNAQYMHSFFFWGTPTTILVTNRIYFIYVTGRERGEEPCAGVELPRVGRAAPERGRRDPRDHEARQALRPVVRCPNS